MTKDVSFKYFLNPFILLHLLKVALVIIRGAFGITLSFSDFTEEFRTESLRQNTFGYPLYIFGYYMILSVVPSLLQLYECRNIVFESIVDELSGSSTMSLVDTRGIHNRNSTMEGLKEKFLDKHAEQSNRSLSSCED